MSSIVEQAVPLPDSSLVGSGSPRNLPDRAHFWVSEKEVAHVLSYGALVSQHTGIGILLAGVIIMIIIIITIISETQSHCIDLAALELAV